MRTLFNLPDDQIEISPMSFCDSSPQYFLAPDVQFLKVGKHDVIIRPKIGSWIVLENNELDLLKFSSQPLKDNRIGEFLYKRGIATKNGTEVNFLTTSSFTEELYFFEFRVTNRCNLSCKYCFAEAFDENNWETNNDATINMARLFVDRIAEFRVKTRSCIPFIIEFTGGEPLLNFEVIRYIVQYAKKQYNDLLNLEFTIQSNITSLTTEQLDFIRSNNIGLGISCDGFKDIHDWQRPFCGGRGSHDKLVRNIKKIQELYPENTGSDITVITKDSQDIMSEIFLYLFLLGFCEISLRPMAELGLSVNSVPPDPDKYVDGLFNILDSVIEPLFSEYKIIVRENHLSLTFQHLLNPYRAFMCERSPCGAAKNICITMPNGDVYPCNQSVGEESLFLGNIKRDSFQTILKSKPAQMLRGRNIKNINDCKDCLFRGWCGSPCPITALRNSGTINAKSAYCDILKRRYQIGLQRLIDGRYEPSLIAALTGFHYPVDWKTPTLKT